MSEANRIIGEAPCPLCSVPVKVRITKKNLLYYTCDHTDGGCGHQVFCRDPAAEKHLARRMTKWVKREDRLAYLGNEALPVKARPAAEPEPELIEPEAEGGPEPEPEIEPEPEPIEPPPPPRRPAQRPTPAKRPVPPQFQKKKAGGLGFFGEDE